MDEVAALVPAALDLVLRGRGARREEVKHDDDAVRGLVGMFDQLLLWKEEGSRTSRALHEAVRRSSMQPTITRVRAHRNAGS
jgi:hypothetical protein